MTYYYDLYDFIVKSDFRLEGIQNISSSLYHIQVSSKDIAKIENPIFSSPLLETSEDQVCFQKEGVGEFYIGQGSEIIVNPEPQVDDETIKHYILKAGMSLIMHQKGLVPFQGGSIRLGKETGLLILGGHAHDKMDLIQLLCSISHCRMMAKELSCLNLDESIPYLVPSYREPLDPLPYWDDLVALKGIIIISEGDSAKVVGEEVLTLGEKLDLLVKETFNHQFLPFLNRQKNHFYMMKKLLNLPIYAVNSASINGGRPDEMNTILSFFKEIE